MFSRWVVSALAGLALSVVVWPELAYAESEVIEIDVAPDTEFSHDVFLDQVEVSDLGWVDDGLRIPIASWERVEGSWDSAESLSEALEVRNDCLEQTLPINVQNLGLRPEQTLVSNPAVNDVIIQTERECAAQSGLLLSMHSNTIDFQAPADGQGFFVFADLDLVNRCIDLVPDGSEAFCTNFSVSSEPVTVAFTGEPDVLVSTLPTVIDFTPVQIGQTVAGASVLVLLVGLPSQLVGNALENAWPALVRTRVAQRVERLRPRKSLPVPLAFGATIVVAALLSSVAELSRVESVGDWATTAVIWLLGFSVISLLGLGVITLITRVAMGLKPGFEFHPSSLVLLGLTAVASLLIGFSPPVIFGLVLGLTFGLTFQHSQEGRVLAWGAIYVLAVGLMSWTAYSLFFSSAAGQTELVAQVLSAIAITAISGLPISLLPLGLLDGSLIARWSKAGLFVMWSLSLGAFLLLASHPGEPIWQAVDNVWLWAGIYAVFVLAALAAWLILRRVVAKQEAPEVNQSVL